MFRSCLCECIHKGNVKCCDVPTKKATKVSTSNHGGGGEGVGGWSCAVNDDIFLRVDTYVKTAYHTTTGCMVCAPTSTYDANPELTCSGANEHGVTSGKTLDECKQACTDIADCISFEFKTDGSCQLSSSCIVANAVRTGSQAEYSLWTLYMRGVTCNGVACATTKM
jgi:hypothetical protein